MATQEEIDAAYTLAYDSEREMAEHLLSVSSAFMNEVNTVLSTFRQNAIPSPVGQFLSQLKNMEMMYSNAAMNVRDYYSIT